MGVTHLNPASMHHNPGFTQAIVVTGPARTIYVGGQNAVTADGQIVGEGDLAAQTEQVFKNLETVLTEAGAKLEHIVKWTIHVVDGQPMEAAFQVFQRVWGQRGQPPTITMAVVAGLANPAFLIEMDAIAVVPE